MRRAAMLLSIPAALGKLNRLDGGQGDRHIFQAGTALKMSQSPACERLPQ